MSDKLSELLRSGSPSRRKFLAGIGASAGAAAIIGCGNNNGVGTVTTTAAPPTTTAAPPAITDVDILNFALNLEYLEAEYYLFATTGAGLSAADSGATAVPTVGGAQVTFATPALQAYALEIAADELAHVRYLRSAITAAGATPVDKPALDLSNSFNSLGAAANFGAFNPFASENDFIVGAFTFEDVGVTAYNGAVTLISNKTYLGVAAAIHATEAYHAAEVRTVLVYGDPAYLALATGISNVRAAASGVVTTGTPAPVATTEVAPTSKTIVPCDSNSLAFHRNTDQVLHIVYLNAKAGAVSSGGFYPNGMNGTIKASAS